MKVEKSNRKFALGQLAMTTSVYYAIPFHEVMEALRRHESGDWGEVCKEDWELNDDAVDNDARLMSVYRSTDNVRFWIITEWDRSVTTVLLPLDY